jgi:hypothetical protein
MGGVEERVTELEHLTEDGGELHLMVDQKSVQPTAA